MARFGVSEPDFFFTFEPAPLEKRCTRAIHTSEGCTPLELGLVADQIFPIDGVRLGDVSAVEVVVECAPRKIDRLLELGVPQIDLVGKLAALHLDSYFDSAMFEVQLARHPFAGHPIHGIFPIASVSRQLPYDLLRTNFVWWTVEYS